jgi:hypothetical protein
LILFGRKYLENLPSTIDSSKIIINNPNKSLICNISLIKIEFNNIAVGGIIIVHMIRFPRPVVESDLVFKLKHSF